MSFVKLWTRIREIDHLMKGSEVQVWTRKPKFRWFASQNERAQWIEVELILRNYELKSCNLATGEMVLLPKRIRSLKERIAEKIAQRMDRNSTVTAPLPVGHPVMVAWEAYKKTGSYANSKSWATKAEHTEGSLWAAFLAGYTMANARSGEEVKTE